MNSPQLFQYNLVAYMLLIASVPCHTADLKQVINLYQNLEITQATNEPIFCATLNNPPPLTDIPYIFESNKLYAQKCQKFVDSIIDVYYDPSRLTDDFWNNLITFSIVELTKTGEWGINTNNTRTEQFRTHHLTLSNVIESLHLKDSRQPIKNSYLVTCIKKFILAALNYPQSEITGTSSLYKEDSQTLTAAANRYLKSIQTSSDVVSALQTFNNYTGKKILVDVIPRALKKNLELGSLLIESWLSDDDISTLKKTLKNIYEAEKNLVTDDTIKTELLKQQAQLLFYKYDDTDMKVTILESTIDDIPLAVLWQLNDISIGSIHLMVPT